MSAAGDEAAGSRSAALRERAATRVADAQRQARRTLTIALAFAIASPVAVVVPHDTGRWLPLHLFLVGSAVSAVSGATQLLAITWSTAPAPTDRVAAAQRWLVAGGAVAVAAGRELEADPLVGAGGVAVVGGLLILAAILVQIRRRSTVDRFHPAIDAYLLAISWAFAGVGLGLTLVVAEVSTSWAEIRGAHIAMNVFGFVGLVILGTLPYFVATQARVKMSPRAVPNSTRSASVTAAIAVAVAVVGESLDQPAIAAVGYAGYAIGIAMTMRLLPSLGRKQLAWAGPRLVQLGLGMAWWTMATVLLATAQFVDDLERSRILAALAVGGLAQVLVASLAYFGPVLRGGGHQQLSAGFTLTRSIPSLIAGNVAGAALLVGADEIALAAVTVWALDVGARAVRLVVGGRERE